MPIFIVQALMFFEYYLSWPSLDSPDIILKALCMHQFLCAYKLPQIDFFILFILYFQMRLSRICFLKWNIGADEP